MYVCLLMTAIVATNHYSFCCCWHKAASTAAVIMQSWCEPLHKVATSTAEVASAAPLCRMAMRPQHSQLQTIHAPKIPTG